MTAIKKWKIAPMHGDNAISLVGVRADNGANWQTTNLTLARQAAPGVYQVQTESGSIYTIKDADRDVGIWPMQLQTKRPGRFANLQKVGIV